VSRHDERHKLMPLPSPAVEQNDEVQRQLESAIMRASDDEIDLALARGARLDVAPLSADFTIRICPSDDSDLTVLARVLASGEEACRRLKFDLEPRPAVAHGQRSSAGRRTMDERWMDVRRRLISAASSSCECSVIPRAWPDGVYTQMRETCNALFGPERRMSAEGNTIIDMLVRTQAARDKAIYGSTLPQMVEDVGALLSRLESASASKHIEKLALRLLDEGKSDIELRGRESAYFIVFCMSLERINELSPDGREQVAKASWGMGRKYSTPLHLATQPIQGVDHRFVLSKLLTNGCDANKASPDTGTTALMMAVKTLSFPSISILLEGGADIDQVDKSGKPASAHISRADKSELAASVKAYLRAWRARSVMTSVARSAMGNTL
jgi:hypothetical protein